MSYPEDRIAHFASKVIDDEPETIAYRLTGDQAEEKSLAVAIRGGATVTQNNTLDEPREKNIEPDEVHHLVGANGKAERMQWPPR